ncbi:LOW QUALITY PROTEIN: integrin alpha-E [Cariama cristata]
MIDRVVKSLRSFIFDTGKMWITPHTASLLQPTVLQHLDGNTTMEGAEERKTYPDFPGRYERVWPEVMILATSSVDEGPGRLRRCTLLQEEMQGKIKGSKNIQDGGIAIDRDSDWILACLQKKHHRAFTATKDVNGVCTLLTTDRRTAFLSLTKTVETKNGIQSKNNEDVITDPSSSVSTDDTNSACGEIFGSAGNNHMCKELGTEIASSVILSGSENAKPDDFQNAKTSILNMMKSMWQKHSKIRFAVMRYGAQIQTELSLQESRNRPTAFCKANIKQQSLKTDIPATLQHVLDKVFESHGSSQTDDKIIIVMAYGQVFLEKHRLRNVMSSLEMAMVKLYAPGTGQFISNQWVPEELPEVIGDWFVLPTYEDLDSFFLELEREIVSDSAENIPTEAPEHRNTSDSGDGKHPSWMDKDKEEKEENGLSSGTEIAFILDGSGCIEPEDFERAKGFIQKMMKTLYEKCFESMVLLTYAGFFSCVNAPGYGVAAVHTQHGPLYVAGAPRHSMRGKVLVFQDGCLKQTLRREQVGSYFGSELCPLDVNHDGVTDLLLVGGPFYHIQGEEERVYVYCLETETGSFTLKGLNVQVTSPFARSGFTVASIGDINGDGYEDIAAGAPLGGQLSKSSSFGSIYIFNGDKDKIKSSFSQRVKASEISSGLQYFGQSIDSGCDFTNDGLQDITAGSLENVMVLGSRTVVHSLSSMRFNPERILIFQNNSIVTAKLCFDTISALPVSQQVFSQLDILYREDLNVKMATRRVPSEDQRTASVKLLVGKDMCSELQPYLLPCDFDCFSRVFLRVKHELYKKNGNMVAVPVLDRYQLSDMRFQLPYKEDCNKTVCTAHLTLTSQIQ